MGLLKSNVYAATDALDCDEGVKFFAEKAKESGASMPEIYFFIRRPISEKYRKIFRRLARQSILKSSLKITYKGIRGQLKKVVPEYKIGMPEFDLDETIQHNPLKIYKRTLNYQDIYGVRRKQKKRKVVLILDTSGSMYGKLLLNAALTTSVLAYNMEKEDYSIVLFNSTAMVLKSIDKKKDITTIIDEILDSEAVGFTNIYIGLEKGLIELSKVKESSRNKFAILISDGNYNRGEDPVPLAKKFPKLHVIGIPAENDADRGIDTCREIARAGKGKFFAVNDYKEIPRALIELLSQT
jgi:Mg-chelatase subunit ChlD